MDEITDHAVPAKSMTISGNSFGTGGTAVFANSVTQEGLGFSTAQPKDGQRSYMEWTLAADELGSPDEAPIEESVVSDRAVQVRLWRDEQGAIHLRIGS